MERLSGLDASFLYLETPRMHMHVAITAVLNPETIPGGYDYEALVRFIEERIQLVPLFRRRLLEVPFKLHHPVWVEDPDFDIIHHVRRVALPAPGGQRELGAMAGRINSTPLDRSRPLWEAWVIEGLQDGHIALLVKVHHCALDGSSGAGLMVHLFDMQPTPRLVHAPKRPSPEAIPSESTLMRQAIPARLEQPMAFAKLATHTLGRLGRLARLTPPEDTAAPVPSTSVFRAPKTHFNGAISARRTVAFARLSLAPIKVLKNALQCTVNDVILAICAGALRRYLMARGELPAQPLIAVCPISVRPSPTPGATNNQVSAMFTSLATEVDDPLERLSIIRSVTQSAKDKHKAIGAHMLQSWAEFAAPRTFNLAARFYTRMRLADRHRPIHNLVISNVPGPPIPIYLAGARLVAAYPMGPVMEGAALNITVMSYCGSVDVGFMVDSASIPDVWDLAEAVYPAFQELYDAAEAS